MIRQFVDPFSPSISAVNTTNFILEVVQTKRGIGVGLDVSSQSKSE
jgi:hypothetical protein